MIKRLMTASPRDLPGLQRGRTIYAARPSEVNKYRNSRAPGETAVVEGAQGGNIVYTLGLATGFFRLAHERRLDETAA